jgi:hypothetical protein
MRMILVAVLGLAFSAPAAAQQLSLTFSEGRVTLDAAAVPVRTILTEWGRLGGTKVVGAERITGAPLTIRLENVPEAQALEVVLRNVAGYMAAPRASGIGASAYDRILVMPTSVSASAAASTPARPGGNANSMSGTQRNVRGGGAPSQPEPPEPADEPQMQDTADAVNEPTFQFPSQNQNPFQPGQPMQPGQPGPFGTPLPPGSQAPVVQFGPAQGQGAISVNPSQDNEQMPVMQFPGMPMPTNNGGFGAVAPPTPGVVGSPTPGMVVQPPPAQPGVRPPGGA